MACEAPPKVLIVDDEIANIELVADIFEDCCEVLFATQGHKALEIAAASAPDVILLDVMMPGMDGYSVCRSLKADPLTRDIPVIFITGLEDRQAEIQGLELGAMDYITKPFHPPIVRVRVRNQIDLKRARDQLNRLAVTDGLTGLANRRRFDEVLTFEHARHVRSGNWLSLIMIDIDHFKMYNDSYGHLKGDDCLRMVSSVLASEVCRTTDLAARYGGEEFACILAETGPVFGARVVAERIRNGVLRLNLVHSASPTAERVTISLGVVSSRCSIHSAPWDLVTEADHQLYLAKSGGRNRTCAIEAG
jgi:diguanylate cyclase (GGDEF)-like protein